MTASDLSGKQRIAAVCERFEAAWKREARPRIEDFLAEATPAERATWLGELVKLELELRRRAGEQPTVAEYQQRFPQYSRWLETLCKSVTAPPTRGFSPNESQTPTVEYSSPDLPNIPGYQILSE